MIQFNMPSKLGFPLSLMEFVIRYLGLFLLFLSNSRFQVALDGKYSREYPVNAGNDLPDDVIYDIAICVDDTTLYPKSDHASDLWQQLESASELESDLRDIVDWSKKCGLLISMLGKLNWFRLTGLITLVLLMGKWMDLFLRKNHLLRCLG